MKVLCTLLGGFLVMPLLTGCGKEVSPQEKIVGKWEATHGDREVIFEFFADGKVEMSDGGREMPGDHTYRLDIRKLPIKLDISGSFQELQTIIEFTEDGGLKMAAPGTPRPEDFSGAETLVFKRVTK